MDLYLDQEIYPKKTLASGDILFKEGDEVKSLFVIDEGKIIAFEVSNDRVVPLNTVVNKGIVGEEFLFLKKEKYESSALALSKVNYFEIPKEEIQSFLGEQEEWVSSLLMSISEKLIETSAFLTEHRIVDDKLFAGEELDAKTEIFIKKSLKLD